MVYNPWASRRTKYVNTCDAITAGLAQISFYHSLLFGPPRHCLCARMPGKRWKSPDHQRQGPLSMGASSTQITRCVTLPQMGGNQLASCLLLNCQGSSIPPALPVQYKAKCLHCSLCYGTFPYVVLLNPHKSPLTEFSLQEN